VVRDQVEVVLDQLGDAPVLNADDLGGRLVPEDSVVDEDSVRASFCCLLKELQTGGDPENDLLDRLGALHLESVGAHVVPLICREELGQIGDELVS